MGLYDLLSNGPFTQVFVNADNPERTVNWLGELRPNDEGEYDSSTTYSSSLGSKDWELPSDPAKAGFFKRRHNYH